MDDMEKGRGLSGTVVGSSPTSSTSPTALPSAAPSRSLKYVALVLMVLQNTSLSLLVRYSRVAGADRYFSSVAVILAELVKVVSCLIVLLVQEGSRTTVKQLRHLFFVDPLDTLKVSVPAAIYAVQNNLLYYGLSNLSVPIYQVTNQLKVFTTAVFAALILGKYLTKKKWFALFLLFVGVSLVQIDNVLMNSSPTAAEHQQSTYLGSIATLMAAMTSGFAGVYFEKMLKGSTASIWLRNIQLGLSGALFGALIAYMNDGSLIAERGAFFGWSPLVSLVILDHAVGGLLVAVVIKFTDNIVKGFAVSISIVLASLSSLALFDFHISGAFVAGAGLVVISTYLYE